MNRASEIPFVTELGEAIDAAIAARASSPRRRGRVGRGALLVAAAVVSLTIAAIAVGRVLSSPDELASQSIACYAAPDLGSDVTVIANEGPPVAACAAALRQAGRTVPPLVACATDSSVAVFPGSDASVCTRLKLQPLPASFAASQAKVEHLAAGITSVEAQGDCLPSGDLARSVQQLLDQQGWIGWKAEVRSASSGPCASVSSLDGRGRRSIQGALDPTRHVIIVSTGAARSTMTLLYGANGLAPAIEQESGNRCYTVATVTALVEERATAVGRSARVELDPPLPRTVTITDARGPRYAAGCAIVSDVRPAADGRNFIATVPRPAFP